MAVILAESVAITKSRLAKGFNGDNLNLNGKVISAQEADNGFKAAGSVNPPYIAVIASGNQKGFAAGAVSAFNDYVKDINFNKYNAENVINKYFDDMQSVVENCGIEGGRLSTGIVCAYDDCVIAAKTGGCHLLRFSEGELFEIALSEDENGRGFQFVDVIADGDIFALIGEEAAADLDYDGIVNTFDSEADLKSMIKDFFKILSTGARGKDCSVVLMKLKCDSERTYAATPLVVPDEDLDDGAVLISSDGFDAEPPVDTDELRKTDGYVTDAEKPATGKRPASAKKKILGFIPIAVLVIILAVTAALYLATRPDDPLKEGSSVSVGDNMLNESVTSDNDFNGSNGMQEVEDTDFGGDVDTPADNTTTAPETTTQAPETTTRRTETTTASTTVTTTEPPVEEPPVEEPPVEEPPVEEPPVEEPPADEPAQEEPAGDES